MIVFVFLAVICQIDSSNFITEYENSADIFQNVLFFPSLYADEKMNENKRGEFRITVTGSLSKIEIKSEPQGYETSLLGIRKLVIQNITNSNYPTFIKKMIPLLRKVLYFENDHGTIPIMIKNSDSLALNVLKYIPLVFTEKAMKSKDVFIAIRNMTEKCSSDYHKHFIFILRRITSTRFENSCGFYYLLLDQKMEPYHNVGDLIQKRKDLKKPEKISNYGIFLQNLERLPKNAARLIRDYQPFRRTVKYTYNGIFIFDGHKDEYIGPISLTAEEFKLLPIQKLIIKNFDSIKLMDKLKNIIHHLHFHKIENIKLLNKGGCFMIYENNLEFIHPFENLKSVKWVPDHKNEKLNRDAKIFIDFGEYIPKRFSPLTRDFKKFYKLLNIYMKHKNSNSGNGIHDGDLVISGIVTDNIIEKMKEIRHIRNGRIILNSTNLKSLVMLIKLESVSCRTNKSLIDIRGKNPNLKSIFLPSHLRLKKCSKSITNEEQRRLIVPEGYTYTYLKNLKPCHIKSDERLIDLIFGCTVVFGELIIDLGKNDISHLRLIIPELRSVFGNVVVVNYNNSKFDLFNKIEISGSIVFANCRHLREIVFTGVKFAQNLYFLRSPFICNNKDIMSMDYLETDCDYYKIYYEEFNEEKWKNKTLEAKKETGKKKVSRVHRVISAAFSCRILILMVTTILGHKIVYAHLRLFVIRKWRKIRKDQVNKK